jgi:cytochrome bd-type quinol oxidase subunit 1
MSLLDLSRWQFAITAMFHMTFPAITVVIATHELPASLRTLDHVSTLPLDGVTGVPGP